MKKVYATNDDTIKAFAEGNTEARNSRGNIYAEGNTLYSYGSHFILAIKLDDKKTKNNIEKIPFINFHLPNLIYLKAKIAMVLRYSQCL